MTRHSAQLAERIGLCDPNGEGSIAHPCADRVLAGDGKVLTPPYQTQPNNPEAVDPNTGEIRTRRHEPDASLHVVGGGDHAFGDPWRVPGTPNG